MKWLNNISVRAKLLLISVPLAIALLASIIVMASEMKQVEKQVTEIYYDVLYTASSALVNGDRDFYQSLIGATGYRELSKTEGIDKSIVDGYLNDYYSNSAQVLERIGVAIEAASRDERLYREMKTSSGYTLEEMEDIFKKDFETWGTSYNVAAGVGDWSDFNLKFDNARGRINEMQELVEEWAGQEYERLQHMIANKIIAVSLVFGLLMLLIAITVISAIRMLRIGIKTVTNNLDELAQGNLNVSFPEENDIGKDDIGAITRSAKMLSDKLSEVMGKSNEMAGELTRSGTELADSANQAVLASGQVTDAVTEISKGAISQAESVEAAAGDTDDMGRNIENIAGDVSEMDRYVEEMKEACDKAMSALDRLIQQSSEVTASVKEIGDTISSTNESAKSISDFTQAITDIATQTNLLSLNASIEAARAGDAGRGFAVVADEIRALADQSSRSADEIKTIVNTLLKDAASSVAVMEKLNDSFGVQAKQLDDTKNNMETMSVNVDKVKDTSADITGRVAELNEEKNDLMEIISDLSAISEENAASTEETNASMEELNATFTMIGESALKLQTLASDLTDTISYFRV
ncbi:MAG: methyl-accepting chemotaxis protein [Lachnospiraceae bacterium]|nr:methyl-accepting chemotaxis protein [Lachnospiraceae bacterium]